MTRLGKIARLPHEIREQLNTRLRDGEEGRQLVEWLNGLSKVKEVLAAKFGGRPINEQNLTEWKQGGFEDWLRHQEDCSHARQLVEQARDLDNEAGEISLEDRLAAPMAMALARLLRETNDSLNDAEKQKTLLNVARELARLRHGSHDAERVRMDREKWQMEHNRRNEEKRKKEEWSAHLQRVKALYPDLSGFHLLTSAQELPREIIVCLEANQRLRRAQAGPNESQLQNVAANASA